MQNGMKAGALALGLCLAVASGAEAQSWRFDLGVNGGGSWATSLLDEDRLTTDSQVEFDPGWLTGAQATLWFGDMFGLRANFGFTDRSLAFDGDETLVGGNTNVVEHVNLWSGTGDVMVRFTAPDETFNGPQMLPYITAGLGARWVNPAGDVGELNVGTDEGEARTGSSFTVGDQTYFLEEKTKTLYRVALGTDARLSETLALRIELGDMMWDAPIHSVTPALTPVVDLDEEDVGDMQHELYGTLGLHMLVGLRDRTRVATVVPAPPAPENAPKK